MKNSLKRFAAALTCAALTIGLILPAQAAEAPPIRVSSYKGDTLKPGERSGLMIGPSGAEYTVTSSDPETVAVEQVLSFWVAVAKAEGTAEIIVSNSAGETGTLTLTVGPGTPSIPITPAVPASNADSTVQPENSEVRQEMIRLINQTRKANGVSELPVSEALMDAAQDCTRQGFTEHNSQYECESALRYGYPHGFGSNLTVFTYNCNTDIAQRAVSHWTYSTGHFQTMTAERYDSIGVGVTLRDGTAYCYMFVGNSNGINPYS